MIAQEIGSSAIVQKSEQIVSEQAVEPVASQQADYVGMLDEIEASQSSSPLLLKLSKCLDYNHPVVAYALSFHQQTAENFLAVYEGQTNLREIKCDIPEAYAMFMLEAEIYGFRGNRFIKSGYKPNFHFLAKLTREYNDRNTSLKNIYIGKTRDGSVRLSPNSPIQTNMFRKVIQKLRIGDLEILGIQRYVDLVRKAMELRLGGAGEQQIADLLDSDTLKAIQTAMPGLDINAELFSLTSFPSLR